MARLIEGDLVEIDPVLDAAERIEVWDADDWRGRLHAKFLCEVYRKPVDVYDLRGVWYALVVPSGGGGHTTATRLQYRDKPHKSFPSTWAEYVAQGKDGGVSLPSEGKYCADLEVVNDVFDNGWSVAVRAMRVASAKPLFNSVFVHLASDPHWWKTRLYLVETKPPPGKQGYTLTMALTSTDLVEHLQNVKDKPNDMVS